MENQYMSSFIRIQAQVDSLLAAQRLDLKAHFKKERKESKQAERGAICEQSKE